MSLLERISNLDRRIIFLTVAIAVIVPLFLPLRLPIEVTPPVKQLYDVIDSLPARSVVLISIDYDPSGAPELQPATLSIMRHCFSRNLRVLVLGLWAPGVPLGTRALEEVAVREYDKKYGVDFVNFGYKPGGAVTLVNLGRDVHDVCREDVSGTSVEDLPMMDDIRAANDIDLVISMSMGVPGSDQWIWYYHARYRGNLATAQTAIGAPKYYQYLQSGQLVGLIGGMKGAAEYERLVATPGLATIGMDSQSIAHLLIIAFVLLGNVIYWLEKRKK
ncbi:MAG: hypothetical protein ABIJ00_07570 [Candidatus Eisenbacteria bacterium]